MILALGLRSQGYMVAKTWATHPRQNFFEYPPRITTKSFSSSETAKSLPLIQCSGSGNSLQFVVILIADVFSGWYCLRESCDQFCIWFKSCCNFNSSSLQNTSLNILMSSANIYTSESVIASASVLIYTTKTTGPSTDPWGMPLITSCHVDGAPFINALCLQSFRKTLIQKRTGCWIL